MERILVTGCCGFIGSHLTEKLIAEGYEVVGIDNFDPFYDKRIKLRNLEAIGDHGNFRFYETDLRQPDFYKVFGEPGFDAVVHLAAKAGVQPSISAAADYVSNNITGTVHLLDYMRLWGIKKFLFTSSSSVYGNNTSVPFMETDAVNEPISPYAFIKRSCELLNFSYHHLYAMDVINLRLFTVYGPRQRPDLAIHKFVRQIKAGQAIKMYGDGSTSRDYTFVEDTVAGFSAALRYLLSHQGVYEIVNLGNNKPVKLADLIAMIEAELKTTAQIEYLEEQEGDVKTTFASIEKAQKLFNYQPNTAMPEGIRAFVAWYLQNMK